MHICIYILIYPENSMVFFYYQWIYGENSKKNTLNRIYFCTEIPITTELKENGNYKYTLIDKNGDSITEKISMHYIGNTLPESENIEHRRNFYEIIDKELSDFDYYN